MILKDFETGGFPINSRSPVLCISPTGGIQVAYNHYDLKKILLKGSITSCIGVWPGRKSTDCFILSVDSYKSIEVPPEANKGIVNAEQITVHFHQGIFFDIEYNEVGGERVITSNDPALFNYITKMGLKHSRTLI